MRQRIIDWLMTDHGYTHEVATDLMVRCEDWYAKDFALPKNQRRTARELAAMFANRFRTPLASDQFA